MALTIGTHQYLRIHNKILDCATITYDSSYPGGATHGYAVTASLFGLSHIDVLRVDVAYDTTNNAALTAVYNVSTGKIQLYWTGSAVSTQFLEITTATNVSTFQSQYMLIGW